MNFKEWLAVAEANIQVSPDPEDERTHNLHVNEKPIGSMGIGHPGGDSGVASRMFPGIVQPGEKVTRIQSIYIDDSMQGYGLGQLLYLRTFDNGGSDWYYNSQSDPPATNTLKTLARKGWIEIHWRPREPGWNQDGELHLVRITPAGRAAHQAEEMVKKDKFQA